MGTPVREILMEYAGGMEDGYQLRGFLPGGGSTDFLTEQHLDVPMDYDSIGKAGSRMGTGTMIILDDKTCPVGFVKNLMEFFNSGNVPENLKEYTGIFGYFNVEKQQTVDPGFEDRFSLILNDNSFNLTYRLL